MNFKSRQVRLRRAFKGQGPSIVVLTTLPNLRYFLNYAGQSFERLACGIISLDSGKSALVIPKLDELKSKNAVVDVIRPWTDSQGYKSALVSALSEVGYSHGRVGCEDGLTFRQMTALKNVIRQKEFHSMSERIATLRERKSQDEVESLLSAGRILEKGYKAITEGVITSGMTERAASYEIKKVLSDAGAADVDFCAVQSGSNSAIPHIETTGKRIAKGDPVLVDISIANEDGYFADYTRTFVVGKPSDKLKEVLSIVESAQRSGIKAASGPNTSAESIDAAARKIIDAAGYGEYFTHRTGHGIGLEVHEQPYIVKGNKAKIKSGMAFTVEPGIYLEGKFGVRIEDNLIIAESGNPIDLPRLPTELIEI